MNNAWKEYNGGKINDKQKKNTIKMLKKLGQKIENIQEEDPREIRKIRRNKKWKFM